MYALGPWLVSTGDINHEARPRAHRSGYSQVNQTRVCLIYSSHFLPSYISIPFQLSSTLSPSYNHSYFIHIRSSIPFTFIASTSINLPDPLPPLKPSVFISPSPNHRSNRLLFFPSLTRTLVFFRACIVLEKLFAWPIPLRKGARSFFSVD